MRDHTSCQQPHERAKAPSSSPTETSGDCSPQWETLTTPLSPPGFLTPAPETVQEMLTILSP